MPPPLRAPVQRNNLNAEHGSNMNSNNNNANNNNSNNSGSNNIYKKNHFGTATASTPTITTTTAAGTATAATVVDAVDSDSGLEVVEEPSLRPSELVRGNHNRTMSTISGRLHINISLSLSLGRGRMNSIEGKRLTDYIVCVNICRANRTDFICMNVAVSIYR